MLLDVIPYQDDYKSLIGSTSYLKSYDEEASRVPDNMFTEVRNYIRNAFDNELCRSIDNIPTYVYQANTLELAGAIRRFNPSIKLRVH